MIRHIVSWTFKDDLSNEEKIHNSQKIKKELESLLAIVPGVVSLEVITDLLDTSTHDIVLNSLFENEKALADYQIHPEHIRVGKFIATMVNNRVCLDYSEI